ncbi:MAG: hypothetical protein U0821_05090 [Chloroflexota bacterium]
MKAFSIARTIRDAIRAINPRDIQTQVQRPIAILVTGRGGSGRATLVRALFGGPHRFVTIADAGPRYHGEVPTLAFLTVDAREPSWDVERTAAGQLAGLGHPLVVAATHGDLLPNPSQVWPALRAHFPHQPTEQMAAIDPRRVLDTRMALVPPALAAIPDQRLALGRHFPTLRAGVAETLIREAAWTNAQLAMASTLPSLIPVVGGFIGGGADLLMLTQTQAALVLRIAAMHEREISRPLDVMLELAPVVGGGFAWRTMARLAAGALPLAAGVVPKILIAYVGTYVTGEAARYYYQHGRPAPGDVLAAIKQRAVASYQRAFRSTDAGTPQPLPAPTDTLA